MTTIRDHNPGHGERMKFHARSTRYHPSLQAMLFTRRLDAAINDWWPNRQFIAGLDDRWEKRARCNIGSKP